MDDNLLQSIDKNASLLQITRWIKIWKVSNWCWPKCAFHRRETYTDSICCFHCVLSTEVCYMMFRSNCSTMYYYS
jgi:hypothetical protein